MDAPAQVHAHSCQEEKRNQRIHQNNSLQDELAQVHAHLCEGEKEINKYIKTT